MTSRLGKIVVALGAVVAAQVHAQMPRMDLAAGFHRIETEVAFTDAMRQQGLMHRQSMPQNQGMLFVFPFAARHCMWMRNTDIPLSVAFIDKEGKILNIENMKPHTENSHCAASDAPYALEMNAGWFAQRGVGPGKKISGLEKAPPPR